MDFPIVAIAASAGGLEALTKLLESLPVPTQMAYVVVSHVAADQESLLSQLLARNTTMPVGQAADGERVEPDRVYVIPPKMTLSIHDGVLRMRVREPGRPHHPADIFFTALSEEHRETAIGIVLSGADADGALGVRAIKQNGGLTFAQEPDTARFPSMPRSAIDTGYIDFVLSPQEIARELTRLREHAYLREARDGHAQAEEKLGTSDEEQLIRVFRHLRASHGVDFSHYKRSTIRRRLARRMAVRRVDRLAEYVQLLDGNAAEVAALYQDFLIRVTHFFRDPETFAALGAQILPRLCEGRSSRDALRIWVPGCATGEEVYSIAITLAEYLGDRLASFRIQIFGSDLSESAIEKARAGFFPSSIASEVSAERLERFFTKEEDARYRIGRQLRGLCIFSRQDVTYDPPFSKIDLISSRNLLIYLDAFVQRRVMQIFHYALRPTGFLMLGSAETVGAASDLFELIDKSNRFYARKAAPSNGALAATRREPSATATLVSPPAADAGAMATESALRAADRWLLSEYSPASLLVDGALNILQIRGETGPYLEFASGAPSLNLSRVARPELLIEISPAITEARETGSRVRREGLRVDDMTDITLQVIPLKTATLEPSYLIVLEDAHRTGGRRVLAPAVATLPESEKDRRLAQLERELVATRQYMQRMSEEHEAVREELKSSSEEVLSANEEYQSTNEELETAKEELQSANEELTTTNEELRERNRDLAILNDDVQRAKVISERARAYADAIVETVREPLLVLDSELKILRANRAFYADFSMRREDLEGHSLAQINDEIWNAPELLQKIGEVISLDTALKDFDLSYSFVPSGAPRTLRLNARKIAADKERTELILLAVEDITERRATAAQLREANQRKDEFLAMLAHELRNPLTPITYAMVLLRQGATADPTHLYALIERQVTRLKRLVDELLDIARISHGHIGVKRELIDLLDVVVSAAEASRPRIEECQHALSMALPKNSIFVEGDSVRLEQVVANLLENAAKYTEPGGLITLTLDEEQGEARLSVKDNGVGIAPDRLESIFELFTQLGSTLDRSAGGLGIGLTLVRRVLELHGGRIEARSAGLGRGSEFVVRLPSVHPDPAVTAPRPSGEIATGGNACRVLIVDDNADAADAIALLARSWGHEVVVALDGASALEIAERFRPQRALVDIGLPGMDGYEVARRLRAGPQEPDLFLVALTGYGQAMDREKALAAGFDRHLVKPGDPNELQSILATHGG